MRRRHLLKGFLILSALLSCSGPLLRGTTSPAKQDDDDDGEFTYVPSSRTVERLLLWAVLKPAGDLTIAWQRVSARDLVPGELFRIPTESGYWQSAIQGGDLGEVHMMVCRSQRSYLLKALSYDMRTWVGYQNGSVANPQETGVETRPFQEMGRERNGEINRFNDQQHWRAQVLLA